MPGESEMLPLPSTERCAKPQVFMGALAVTLPVAAAVVWRDTVSLFRYPFPVGVDGFYYAQQIKSILVTGRLYYPSRTPLVFCLIASVCGRHSDVVKCIKITSITIEVLLFLGVWTLLWQLTRSHWITWWGGVIVALLPSHLFLLADFTKELFCFTLLAWSTVCIHWAVSSRRHWPYGLAVALIILAILSHVSALLLLVTLAIGVGVLKLSHTQGYIMSALICLSWCAALVIELSPSLLPWFAHGSSVNLPPAGSTWWTAERLGILTVSVVFLVITMGTVELARPPLLSFGTVALLALCVTANPWFDQNSDFVFGRASMTANLQLGLLVAGLLYSRQIGIYKRDLWPIYAVLACFLILAIASPSGVRGLDDAYLKRRAELVDALLQTRIPEEHAIVIAPQGDQFAVTYFTGLPSQHSWTGGFTIPVYWLLFGTSLGDVRDGQRRYVVKSDKSLRKEWQTYTDDVREALFENNPELLVAGYSP